MYVLEVFKILSRQNDTVHPLLWIRVQSEELQWQGIWSRQLPLSYIPYNTDNMEYDSPSCILEYMHAKHFIKWRRKGNKVKEKKNAHFARVIKPIEAIFNFIAEKFRAEKFRVRWWDWAEWLTAIYKSVQEKMAKTP